jgi:hypothetical protein
LRRRDDPKVRHVPHIPPMTPFAPPPDLLTADRAVFDISLDAAQSEGVPS